MSRRDAGDDRCHFVWRLFVRCLVACHLTNHDIKGISVMKISFCGPCEQVSNHFLSMCRVLSPCKEVGDIFPDPEASKNGIAEWTFSRSRSELTLRRGGV